MPGVNRYTKDPATAAKALAANSRSTCVFISHKREDWELAIQIAGILGALDVDFWLDLQELTSSEPRTESEHLELANAIELGITGSTHLLAAITPRTKGSMWVPFEIGHARARSRPLAFLLHKDVEFLPSYFAFGTRLVDQAKLYRWAQALSETPLVADTTGRTLLANDSKLDRFVPKHRSVS